MKKFFKLIMITCVFGGFWTSAFAQGNAKMPKIVADNVVINERTIKIGGTEGIGDGVVVDEGGVKIQGMKGIDGGVVVDEGGVKIQGMEDLLKGIPMNFQEGANVECTGVVEVLPADEESDKNNSSIVLKVGEEIYNLMPSENQNIFKNLKSAIGKTINLKGIYLPANETRSLPVLKVTDWSE